jgi:hypothetical protein
VLHLKAAGCGGTKAEPVGLFVVGENPAVLARDQIVI